MDCPLHSNWTLWNVYDFHSSNFKYVEVTNYLEYRSKWLRLLGVWGGLIALQYRQIVQNFGQKYLGKGAQKKTEKNWQMSV